MKRITVANLNTVPAVIASTNIGIKLADTAEASKAEVSRLNSLRKDANSSTQNRAALKAAGQNVPPLSSITNAIEVAMATFLEDQQAQIIHAKEHDKILAVERQKIGQAVKPDYDKHVANTIVAALVDVIFPALCIGQRLQDDLHSQGIGHAKVCTLDLEELFGSPFDRASNINVLLRQAAAQGYLSRAPEAVR